MGRDATLWLLERGVRVTGTDGWSWDAPFSHTRKRWLETHDPSIVWEGHRASMDIGYCHIEKLTNLDQLPRYRFSHLLLPIQDPRRLGRLRARRRHSRRLKPLDATRHPKRMTTLLRKHPMAKASRKVIMTCAVTGGIHTPTMSEGLPYKPADIASQAIAAAEAGASILHLHARDPQDGRPTPDPDVFMQFLPTIKQNSDAVVNITTGGGLGMTVEQRLAAPLRAAPEMCSLNMGSMNFGIFPMAAKYNEWKFEWEKPFLLASDDFIFRNTFKDIAYILQALGGGAWHALRVRML